MSEANLSENVVKGAMSHMNADHQHNLLDYARVLGGHEWATSAIMTALDANGFELNVQGEEQQADCRIDFPEPVADAKSLRVALVKMAQAAQIEERVKLSAVAEVATNKAERYMKALVNHFNRKVEGSYEGKNGRIQFPFGDCHLVASETSLKLTVLAESETLLERTQQVVADHLLRFSGKDALTAEWQLQAEQ